MQDGQGAQAKRCEIFLAAKRPLHQLNPLPLPWPTGTACRLQDGQGVRPERHDVLRHLWAAAHLWQSDSALAQHRQGRAHELRKSFLLFSAQGLIVDCMRVGRRSEARRQLCSCQPLDEWLSTSTAASCAACPPSPHLDCAICSRHVAFHPPTTPHPPPAACNHPPCTPARLMAPPVPASTHACSATCWAMACPKWH